MPGQCPKCDGTGFVLKTGEDGVTSATRCRCDVDGREERLERLARIPRRYAHCTFDQFEGQTPSLKAALRAAREWFELWPGVEQGLLFLGTPGTGKTHLAVAIARELIRAKGTRVLFCEQRALLKALQGTFESGADQRESQVLGPVLEAEVLILDDLGAARTTAWARDVMHDLIAYRYNEEKPLIITSNLRLGDEPETRQATPRAIEGPLSIKDRLGDALVSRLHEMCRIVRIRGEDYRTGVLAQRSC